MYNFNRSGKNYLEMFSIYSFYSEFKKKCSKKNNFYFDNIKTSYNKILILVLENISKARLNKFKLSIYFKE